MQLKPGDQVTLAREVGTHDWTTPVFTDEPYENQGLVTGIIDGVVYVWWHGTDVMDSQHDPSELRLIK
jgi:hypothetical protein